MQIPKEAITLGAIGAVAVYATRAFLPSVAMSTVSAPGPTPAKSMIPQIMPAKDGFGLEWFIIPAAVGYYIATK